MRIFKEPTPGLDTPEIHIKFSELSSEIQHIEEVLLAMDISIDAKSQGEIVKLLPADILYVESVDKKTYLYTPDSVYEASEKLYQLEEMLGKAGFIRIRKNCILNKYKLKSIKIAQNSHIEATLKNDEKVIVTRKYLDDIKRAF